MRKVMLVEDEELILQGLKYILDWEEMGMQVIHTAHNGREALELWQQDPVDIIITDINMPVMDGLEFLKELRKTQSRVRCIILTGYDEFEYARKAISLDVEDYILKPINEEELQSVVELCDERLTELDREQASNMDDKAGWIQFLRDSLSREEEDAYIALLPEMKEELSACAAVMKLDLESLKSAKMSDVFTELQKKKPQIRAIYLSASELLLLFYLKEGESGQECSRTAGMIQNQIESSYGILSFISIGTEFKDYHDLPKSYQEAVKLQKYQIIEGYGSCITAEEIKNRKSEDITIDDTQLRKLIFKKDKDAAVGYIEDLFINNISKDAAVDDFYHICLQITMLLQDIKVEYKLQDYKNMQNLTEMIGKIYQAEDLFAIKTLFIGEVAEIITYLHEEDSQYTPVVKQILSEVQKNYREDMNLKTLAYKYNMNASYLGQIFQKEVGCSFAQYLSNTKNGIAKDLILNTNMRINDIAKEVGYPDTSYFYRKFKQCYGVSPASLREMKKY